MQPKAMLVIVLLVIRDVVQLRHLQWIVSDVVRIIPCLQITVDHQEETIHRSENCNRKILLLR